VETHIRDVTDSHLDWFWQQRSLRELGREMFPNCKEISESVAAYRAIMEYLAAHTGPDLQV